MANTKISALTAVAAALSTHELAVNEGGASKKVTLAQIRTLLLGTKGFSVASQAPAANTVTYLTGSGILVPAAGISAGMTFRWYISVTKTAAGTATPIWTPRIGSLQTTGDTTIATITGTAQVATASGTLIVVTGQVLVASATGTIAFGINTGAASFGIGGAGVSAALDLTGRAGQYVGLAVNTGAAAAWTINSVAGEVT